MRVRPSGVMTDESPRGCQRPRRGCAAMPPHRQKPVPPCTSPTPPASERFGLLTGFMRFDLIKPERKERKGRVPLFVSILAAQFSVLRTAAKSPFAHICYIEIS